MGLHKDQSEANLHEPKLVSTATSGQTYVANGAGSGAWADASGTNIVIVNVKADFPTPAGGTITLAANTSYKISDNVNITSDNITYSEGSDISGNGVFVATLTYTGTGSMMVGVDVNGTCSNLTVNCATAKVFDWSETASGGLTALVVRDLVVTSCLAFSTCDKLRGCSMKGILANSCTDGLKFTGDVYDALELTSVTLVSTETAFVAIDLTNSTHKIVRIDSVIPFAGAGSIGLKGGAANVNITTGFVALISNMQFDGVTTALSGITLNDFRYNFQGNGGLADSQSDAMVSMTANATVTALTSGVPALVAGTFTEERAIHFSTTAAGRVTYVGERDVVLPVDIAITLDPVSGTNKTVRAYLALNGSIITNSGKAINVDNGDAQELTVLWQLNMQTNDFLEIFIENETDSVDFTVVDAILRVR